MTDSKNLFSEHLISSIGFNWETNHPDQGKEIDLVKMLKAKSGVSDASLKIIPWTGYGDTNVLRQLIMRHQPRCNSTFYRPKILEMVTKLNQKLEKTFRFYFITFGMTYQTLIIIEIIMKVVIG